MTLKDLPHIKIRRHSRAKHLRLRIDIDQIYLTAPQFCSQRQIQQFIQQSEDWLISTWQLQQQKRHDLQHNLPKYLRLFNQQQPMTIIYQPQKAVFQWHEREQILYIRQQQPILSLKQFVIAYAKIHLPRYLQDISQQIGLKFQQCTIRQVKTRWGSCSRKQDIMLNSALVLCDQDVVKYVCIHELVHTKHFNHGTDFWLEVQRHDLDYKQHHHDLKQYHLPDWWSEK
ncbi:MULTISPECIES: YgjP-like metallopeptidase domain-containing protein [unclassified Acinetobacter]|uniref:YgjP-like metallopeptidase domain-containing protein n=1 Tax=unclassified Acinetobacter TaxID=196816 RepID=UPI0029352EA5|nr:MULTISPECIES: YgjP-like metallopeptidase domain-containing protein [unclassified Acinetobacter]WOE32130.1 DUF45 domain-containing protein [Acinetobacter sp. SAAs470]WOE37599.1 DUF45 domain-containing protein [Acinetobacter sp. SAAs474]